MNDAPDQAAYLDAFRIDVIAIAEAARGDLDALVPACPEWTMARLLGHLGAIYVSITKNIRVGGGEDVVNELEDLELAPEYEEWFRRDLAQEWAPPGVVDWFRQSAGDLAAAFEGSDMGDRTWTWHEADQTVGFWVRRMTHETAIHRWDAQSVHGQPGPITPRIAADGVDEILTVYAPRWCRPESPQRGSGETYRFQSTDGSRSWLVRMMDDGMEVARNASDGADVTLRGTASDLMLFLWHRIPLETLQVDGDRDLAVRYFEFVPPD